MLAPTEPRDEGSSPPPRLSRVTVALALVCVLASGVVVSCGKDSKSTATSIAGASPTPNLVTNQDIAQAKAGSPERVLLSWIQAVQFQDGRTARELVDPTAYKRVGKDGFNAAVAVVGPELGKPRIVSVRMVGRTAVVRVVLVRYRAPGTPPVDVQPSSFPLKRSHSGAWVLSELNFLTSTGDKITAARKGKP